MEKTIIHAHNATHVRHQILEEHGFLPDSLAAEIIGSLLNYSQCQVVWTEGNGNGKGPRRLMAEYPSTCLIDAHAKLVVDSLAPKDALRYSQVDQTTRAELNLDQLLCL